MHAHRALPTLLRMGAAIDQLCIVQIGPFEKRLAQEVRAQWLESGNKLRPADVEQYVAMLARHIADTARRDEFVNDGLACIRL